MPIDSQIPLGVRLGPGIDVQGFVSSMMQARERQEYQRALEEQRRASAEKTRLQTADLQQKDTDRRDMGVALQVGKGIRDATIAHALKVNPNVVPQLTEYFDKTETQFNAARKLRDDAKASELNALGDVMNEAIKGGGTPEVLNLHLSYAAELWPDYADKIKGIGDQLRALPDDAGRVQMLKTIRGMAPAYRETSTERDKRENPQPLQGSPGTQFLDPKTRQPFHTVPLKPDTPTVGSFEDYVVRRFGQNPTPAQIEQARKAFNQADDRPPISIAMAQQGVDNVKDAVAGMKEGTIPPILPGRASKEYVGLLAEAQRQGYDLSAAATDWSAAQKHFATLNGAQQTRIRQAVDTAYHSLDVIEDLAGKWKGGMFPPLNKLQLKAARNGILGKNAQTIATQLEAQITDVASELANVYMGGNSPTDHALQLAEKNLKADWSLPQLTDALALARKNLQIRQNAIKNVGAIGASEVNPYVPGQAAAPSGGPAKGTQTEGQTRPIAGYPGTEETLRNGKWIRTK